MENKNSGKSWVEWANTHAKNSKDINQLVDPFKTNVLAFKKALEDAGAKIVVRSTKRSKKRAYLFHWAWKISLGKVKPKDATKMEGVPIEWDHGDDKKSIAGAKEMVSGFGLAVPPASNVAPSLKSNHIAGKAIDMNIKWTGKIKVKKKGVKTPTEIAFMNNVNGNVKLHEVVKSFGVIKHTRDRPHWSVNGR